MQYVDAVFWQAEIICPKDCALEIEEFFLKSGAQSTYELLYAEGRTSNLVEDNTSLYFFFEETFPTGAFVPMALATLGYPDLTYSIKQVQYADYLKEFEKSFKAFALTEKTALVPPWDRDSLDVANLPIKLYLVPGMAFGTGKHATTQLMVEYIEQTIKTDDTVIDMGCGSGILAIAALLWGAESVYGIDVESLAIESAETNTRLNETETNRKFTAEYIVGDFADLARHKTLPEKTVFLSNILPNIFEANSSALREAIMHSRKWALSGIPISQAESFEKFLNRLDIGSFRRREKEDWCIFYS
jgi:ribosomal protein L11 methyltransferase